MPKHLWLFVFLVAMAASQSSAQDLASRLAQFELQKAEVSDRFSVLIERVTLTDGWSRISGWNKDDPPKFEYDVTTMRALQRIVFGDKGHKKRMDGLEYPILDDSDLTNMARECQLIHENVGWYFSPSQNKLVQQFQVKGGVVPMSTETKWSHPFELVKCLSGGLRVDHKQFITSYSPNTLDEETLKDGRERLTVFTDTGAVLRLTFNKEEGWLVEEVEFMKPIISMSREEEIAAARALATGGPRKQITVTKEMLKEYKTVAINRTEWKEVDKNYWVPWVTRISTESRNENVENEIRFREWKFGEDVDASLLDEANFTPEKIAASIDFKAIRDGFDRAK